MYYVFSDESGQTGDGYDDVVQPVLCQTAIIVNSKNIQTIEAETNKILAKFDLSESQEIHAHPCLLGKDFFSQFDKEQRHEFLKEFIQKNLRYIFKIHYMGMLKPFVNEEVREKAGKSGLHPFMQGFIWLIVIIDKYFEHILKKNYMYFFDTTTSYRRQIKKAISILKDVSNESLKINCLLGDPQEIDSKESRIIQLADSIGYYLNRHRQFEVQTFNHRESLDKHKDKVFEIYNLLKPKFLNFIRDELLTKIDWLALQNYDFIKL